MNKETIWLQCNKCKQPVPYERTYQTAVDGWKAIYSMCCDSKMTERQSPIEAALDPEARR